MPKLRRFLYLDNEIVGQFLAQVEGGEFDEQRITDQQSTSSGIGASVKAGPASAHADRGKTGSSQAETVLKQSGPSRFNRLHSILETEHGLSTVNAADDAIWEGLEVGEIIEAVVTVEIPEFFQTMDQMSDLVTIAPILDALTGLASLGLPGLDVSEDKLAQIADLKGAMPAITGISSAVSEAPLPVMMHLVDAPKYKFLAVLDRSLLAVDRAEIVGEARALIKIDRHIAKGKPETIPLMPGVPQKSRAQRRASGGQENSSTLTLRAPAARATCIAIYR
jgi:hypothetical protein